MDEHFYNLEAERGLIGVCLLGGIEESIAAGVDGSWFYDLKHQQVYEILEGLHERNQSTGTNNATQELRERNLLDKVGGPVSLTQWEDQAPTKHNAPYWLSKLFSCRVRRMTKGKLESLLARLSGASTDEIDSLVSDLQNHVLDLKDHVSKVEDETLKATVDEIVAEIEERFTNKSDTPWGIPTGFLPLDNALGGLREGSVYVIAGRPGQGKTAMALSIARNILISGSPVAMFSLEMTKKELTMRLMAAHGDLNMMEVYRGILTEKEFHKLSKSVEVKMLPLHCNDRSDLNINILRSEARRYVQNFGCRVIIIDYLQLLEGTKEAKRMGKYEEVSEISRNLKTMANELKVPIIALAQLNRELEKGARRKPQLSDLRGSGSIEQDADCVMFLHEPETEDAPDFINGTKRLNMYVAKNRNGQPNMDIAFEFKAEYTRFDSMSPLDR